MPLNFVGLAPPLPVRLRLRVREFAIERRRMEPSRPARLSSSSSYFCSSDTVSIPAVGDVRVRNALHISKESFWFHVTEIS